MHLFKTCGILGNRSGFLAKEEVKIPSCFRTISRLYRVSRKRIQHSYSSNLTLMKTYFTAWTWLSTGLIHWVTPPLWPNSKSICAHFLGSMLVFKLIGSSGAGTMEGEQLPVTRKLPRKWMSGAIQTWVAPRSLNQSNFVSVTLKVTSGQECAGRCLTTSSRCRKCLICSICWLSWYKYYQHHIPKHGIGKECPPGSSKQVWAHLQLQPEGVEPSEAISACSSLHGNLETRRD